MAKRALGKGLSALIGRPDSEKAAHQSQELTRPTEPSSESLTAGESVLMVPLEKIVPSPLQPRKAFREGELDELVESIREHGIIQPLIVRKVGQKFELIAGERRFRAAKKLGRSSVPAILRVATDQDVLEMALIENLQREDLNPIEESEAYVRLARDFGLKQSEIAQRVGKNRATVANSMRLLDLAPEVRDHLAQNRISVGHAKALLAIRDESEQAVLADMVVKKKLTVRATESLVNERMKPARKNANSRGNFEIDAAIASIQNRLRAHLATQVSIKHQEKKGKIEIEYYGNDDLDRLLEVMNIK